MMKEEKNEDLVYIDQSGMDNRDIYEYGWGLKGQRIYGQRPGKKRGCLLQMIRDEAEPNVPLAAAVPERDEFDRWYAEAVVQGFCLNIPRRYLSTVGTEPLVKVVDKSCPERYRVMPWREARAYQKQLLRGR